GQRSGTHNQRSWIWVPATGSPRRKRRGVPLAGTTRVGAIMPTAFLALFTFQTAHLVPAAHFCARGLQLCFANPNRAVGGAPRDVRERARHPCATPSCVKDARERAYNAACQALARRLASHDAAIYWRKYSNDFNGRGRECPNSVRTSKLSPIFGAIVEPTARADLWSWPLRRSAILLSSESAQAFPQACG